jgi:bifunctional non-homologous end joining protein LigD
MLASMGQLPVGENWVYELKWDGVRALVAHDPQAVLGSRLRIWSRAGNVVTDTYPELTSLTDALAHHKVVLDGEIVAFDAEGRPSFNRLQGRLGVRAADAIVRARTNPVVYVVFDGLSTRSLPWSARRSVLEGLDLGSGANWRVSTVHTDGPSLLEVTRDADLEGVVAKRVDAPYSSGARSLAWVKLKNLTIDEFVIGGWVPGEGRRESMIGSLLLGLPQTDDLDGALIWVGKVGTGFNMTELERLHARLEPSRSPTRLFLNDPGERTAVFVSSRLRCRVEYREITKDGILRFPSFKGMVDETDPFIRSEEEDL